MEKKTNGEITNSSALIQWFGEFEHLLLKILPNLNEENKDEFSKIILSFNKAKDTFLPINIEKKNFDETEASHKNLLRSQQSYIPLSGMHRFEKGNNGLELNISAKTLVNSSEQLMPSKRYIKNTSKKETLKSDSKSKT